MDDEIQTLRNEALGILSRVTDRTMTFEQAQMELDALIIESIKVLNDRVHTLEEAVQIPEKLATSGAESSL